MTDPQWREFKAASLETLRSAVQTADPQPEPPTRYRDREQVARLATELKAVGVSCELHVYATGGHGYGMRNTGHPVNTWPQRCLEWMTKQGYLKK